jgi:hypothetical protein
MAWLLAVGDTRLNSFKIAALYKKNQYVTSNIFASCLAIVTLTGCLPLSRADILDCFTPKRLASSSWVRFSIDSKTPQSHTRTGIR